MGLFGGGGSNSTVLTTVENYEGTNSPQVNQAGAAGSLALTYAPQVIGSGTVGSFSPNVYNAPLYITPSVNTGDSALQAAQQTAQAAVSASSPNANTIGSSFQSLLTGNDIYWVLGALVIVMLTRGHGGRYG
jgi:hypothetical protein